MPNYQAAWFTEFNRDGSLKQNDTGGNTVTFQQIQGQLESLWFEVQCETMAHGLVDGLDLHLVLVDNNTDEDVVFDDGMGRDVVVTLTSGFDDVSDFLVDLDDFYNWFWCNPDVKRCRAKQERDQYNKRQRIIDYLRTNDELYVTVRCGGIKRRYRLLLLGDHPYRVQVEEIQYTQELNYTEFERLLDGGVIL